MVSQAKIVSLDPPISEVALYERIPKEELYQYTPDLPYVMEITETPMMIPISR